MSLTEDMLRLVHKATSRMRTQIGMMLARGVIGAVNDGSGIQTVTITVLSGESIDDVPHLQPGGLSHVSIPGAEAAVGCVGGSRDNPFVVGVANRGSRPTGLPAGATVVYAIGPLAGQLRISTTGVLEATGSSGTADDFVTQSGKIDGIIAKLDTLLRDTPPGSGWTPVPNDGGLALQTAYKLLDFAGTVPGSKPPSTASSNLKADD